MITRRQLFEQGGGAGLFGFLRTINTYPADDTHCHPLTGGDAITTPDACLQRISVTAMGAPGRWRPPVGPSTRRCARTSAVTATTAHNAARTCGVLTEAEALDAARRILYQNNREVYRLEAA